MRRVATTLFVCATLIGVVHCGDDDAAAKAAANACPSAAAGCTDACPGVLGREVYGKVCSDSSLPLWCRPAAEAQSSETGCVARGKSIYITPTKTYHLDADNLRPCTSQEEAIAHAASCPNTP